MWPVIDQNITFLAYNCIILVYLYYYTENSLRARAVSNTALYMGYTVGTCMFNELMFVGLYWAHASCEAEGSAGERLRVQASLALGLNPA